MLPLSILFGSLVGFTLGLTGGGGSLLAVPLLVYGLAIAPREAFGVSLAAVGATALVGVIPRIRAGQVEVGTGVLFAIAGMIGAPLGTWVAGMISETVLLVLFSVLMLVVVLVSVSGVASHFAAGRGISFEITGLFVLGGVIGMSLGQLVSERLPAPVLQKVFAGGIVAVAVFVAGNTLA